MTNAAEIDATEHRAQFVAMTEGTAEDWAIIAKANGEFSKRLPDRVMDHLRLLRGDAGGFAVDRFEHSLQTATRAYRADKDDEYIVCALLHDIGDVLGSFNHPDIGAAIVRPFVAPEYHWMVEKHGIFQGYHFFHHLGLDRNMRDQFAEHPYYDVTVEFCAEYDQNSFDPKYDSMTLEDFEPALRSVLATPKRSIYVRDDVEAAAR